MIQVCSQCGTRWNVRDRQRVWCPRCHGTLLAPSSAPADPQWGARPTASPLQPSAQKTPPRLPTGYRWIAVRPGAAPPVRRGRRTLGPTPRYASIPPWGLVEHFDVVDEQAAPPRTGPSVGVVRIVLIATMAAFAAAALAKILQYALLLINRSVLLHPVLASAATLFGLLTGVVAAFLLLAAAVVLTNWLIARRAGAFAHRGETDPSDTWWLWIGCLTPVVNVIFAPVFVLELATAEGRDDNLRRPTVLWWIVWAVSYLVSGFAIATAFTANTQAIADNTMLTAVGYLIGLAALLLLLKVVHGFESRPVEKPVTRWVMVPDTRPQSDPVRDPVSEKEPESAAPVESEGQNPAA
jgi:hypothetical protein